MENQKDRTFGNNADSGYEYTYTYIYLHIHKWVAFADCLL